MKNRILVVSLHINGGCFQYGNELFSRLKTLCDIYIPNIVTEQLKISRFKKLLYWKRPTPLRLLSLAWFLVKIVLLGLTGYYKALLLAGFSSWDYYILKAWKLTGRPPYLLFTTALCIRASRIPTISTNLNILFKINDIDFLE